MMEFGVSKAELLLEALSSCCLAFTGDKLKRVRDKLMTHIAGLEGCRWGIPEASMHHQSLALRFEFLQGTPKPKVSGVIALIGQTLRLVGSLASSCATEL
jgi:hypothetical protein